ncbi:MAG: class I SAM-dependent methyltransferase [Methylobacteriaceae bacterium]|nr:class I SAM-dependent methyltransferase [Methylobacteriaceae bacterium]
MTGMAGQGLKSRDADPGGQPLHWACEAYPDYAAEVNSSIRFSGLDQSFFTIGKAGRAIDLLTRLVGDPRRIDLLDIGCGIGLIHPHLGGVGRITGVDVSQEALGLAQSARSDVRYQAYDGHRLPFAEDTFDAAMTICVMHHVPADDWHEFVGEARRVIRPGGVFLVFEHNPWNPLTRLAVSRCSFDHDAVLLPPPRMASILAACGLRDVGREFLFFTPFAAPAIQSVERRLKFLPLGAQYVAYGRKA